MMTAKLVGPFVSCLDDEFASVRAEACIACAQLRIRDALVVSKLARCIRDDPIHRVKALAIQGVLPVALCQVSQSIPTELFLVPKMAFHASGETHPYSLLLLTRANAYVQGRHVATLGQGGTVAPQMDASPNVPLAFFSTH